MNASLAVLAQANALLAQSLKATLSMKLTLMLASSAVLAQTLALLALLLRTN
jgi:hypothetical protein